MKSSRGSQDPEQQEEACRTEGGLTVAMGRLPRVACLCLGQSAFIPPLVTPQGLASWELNLFQRKKRGKVPVGVCDPQGWATVFREGGCRVASCRPNPFCILE